MPRYRVPCLLWSAFTTCQGGFFGGMEPWLWMVGLGLVKVLRCRGVKFWWCSFLGDFCLLEQILWTFFFVFGLIFFHCRPKGLEKSGTSGGKVSRKVEERRDREMESPKTIEFKWPQWINHSLLWNSFSPWFYRFPLKTSLEWKKTYQLLIAILTDKWHELFTHFLLLFLYPTSGKPPNNQRMAGCWCCKIPLNLGSFGKKTYPPSLGCQPFLKLGRLQKNTEKFSSTWRIWGEGDPLFWYIFLIGITPLKTKVTLEHPHFE